MRCYHGTIKKNYKKILKDKKIEGHSYWSPFEGNAISMGGPYVFVHDFPEITDEWIGKGNWEYIYPNDIPSSEIIAVLKYDVQVISFNSKLNTRLHKERILREDKEYCEICHSYEELTYLENGHEFKPSGCSFSHNKYKSRWTKHIIMCPVCGLKNNPDWDEILITIEKVEKKLKTKFDPYNPKHIKWYIKLWTYIPIQRKIDDQDEPNPPG